VVEVQVLRSSRDGIGFIEPPYSIASPRWQSWQKNSS